MTETCKTETALIALTQLDTALSHKDTGRTRIGGYRQALLEALNEVEYYDLKGNQSIPLFLLECPQYDILTIPLVAATACPVDPAFVDWLAGSRLKEDVSVPGNFQALMRREKAAILAHRTDFKADSDVAYLLENFERAVDALSAAVAEGGYGIDVASVLHPLVDEGVDLEVASRVMYYWHTLPVWKTLPDNCYKAGALNAH